MGKAIIPIELDNKEYQELGERLREHNYIFHMDLDLKSYAELLIKAELALTKRLTRLD